MKDRKTGFTLVELLVVIAIIAILVAILMPAVQRVRANARSAESRSNLSQLAKAMKHYEGQRQKNLEHDTWRDVILPYVDGVADVLVDPGDTNGPVSYALTNKVVAFGANDHAKIAIIESDDEAIVIDNTNCGGGSDPVITGEPAFRHLGMTNAALYDGSARSFEPETIDLDDTSHEPLVVWWLPDREHGNVCGTVVTVDNPNPLPTPTSTEPSCTPTDHSRYYVHVVRENHAVKDDGEWIHYFELGPMCRDTEADPHTDQNGIVMDAEYWETETGYLREGPESFILVFDMLEVVDWNDMLLMFDPQPDCSMKIKHIGGDYVPFGYALDLYDSNGVLLDDSWEPGDVYIVPPQP